MRRVALAFTGACLSIAMCGPTVHAAPRDALTEDSSTRTASQAATDFVDRSVRRCHQKRVGTSLTLNCDRGGCATFTYEFRVPGKAINIRPTVSASEGIGVDGTRSASKRYDAYVGFCGGGTHTIDSVAVQLDVPTAYDSRPCVTDGEWARINVWLGGFGGSIQEIAAVFDTNGKRTFLSQDFDGFRYQNRAYQRCGSAKTRKVTFHHNAGEPGWHSYWG